MKGGISMRDFRTRCARRWRLLKIDESFATRYVNEGFCGGEKKRLEMLQMAVLEPEMAILDETDSGLDIDALRIVAEGVNAMLNPAMGVLLITHYQRLLNYIKPDVVHVLAAGRIVKTRRRTSPFASRTRATARSCARQASRPTCPTKPSWCRSTGRGRAASRRRSPASGAAMHRDRAAAPRQPAATGGPRPIALRADFPILRRRRSTAIR